VLHGRSAERTRLATLLTDAEASRSGVLVMLGEPGVGKSALLGELRERATGFRVLRTQGLESEAPLAFAALHRLLRPVEDMLASLPAPQAHALSVALGLQMHEPVEPFMVALATLSTLAEAAETAPVLCLVDDAHGLDAASRDALLFTARRLTDERIAIVFTARASEGGEALSQGLPTLALGGLDENAAAAVVAERYGHAVPGPVVASLLAQTGGNPLALVELPATLTPAQLAGTDSLPDRLPLRPVRPPTPPGARRGVRCHRGRRVQRPARGERYAVRRR
jgi:predicted ATPase